MLDRRREDAYLRSDDSIYWSQRVAIDWSEVVILNVWVVLDFHFVSCLIALVMKRNRVLKLLH